MSAVMEAIDYLPTSEKFETIDDLMSSISVAVDSRPPSLYAFPPTNH